MKRTSLSISLLTLALAIQPAFAQETFFGALDQDYVFNNGVLIQGVTTTADGVASVTLDGAGSLTAASAAGGGFPRLVIYGGSTITSTRSFATDEINKTSWSGQFDAPSSSVKPGFFDINAPGAGFSSDYEATESFGMGLSNEEFSFSAAADVVLPTGQQAGQKLYLANEKSDGTWDVDTSTFCIVTDSLCVLSLTKINRISLIKEKFENCPVQNIANGTVGSTPGCVYTCNSGFQLNENANGCDAVVSNDEFENSFNEITAETNTMAEQQIFENQLVAPVKEYEFPPGHFRYRASGEKFYRYLNEDGLDGEVWVDPTERNQIKLDSDAGKTRAVNSGYLSRNPRTAEEQLAAQATSNTAADSAEDDANFMSYLIQMRNHFGENAQENHYTAMSAEGGAEMAEGGEASSAEITDTNNEGGEFLSSGPLLPSTGPGIFVTIAVVGFALMMFGARRS